MPIYEFECDQHGVFELLKRVSEVHDPGLCPRCALPGQRLISVPTLSAMARSEVVARDRNERSRHEPRVSRGPAAATTAARVTTDARRRREGSRPILGSVPG